jgi:hypothetical protein
MPSAWKKLKMHWQEKELDCTHPSQQDQNVSSPLESIQSNETAPDETGS